MIKRLSLLFLLITLIGTHGCDNGDNENEAKTQPPATVHTDLEGLRRLVNLPYEPLQVRYVINKIGSDSGMVPGPTDWELVAYIKLHEVDAAKLGPKPSDGDSLPAIAAKKLKFVMPENHAINTEENKEIQASAASPELYFREPLLGGTAYLLNEQEVLLHLITR